MHGSIRHLKKIRSCIQDFMADRSSSLRHLFLKKPVKQASTPFPLLLLFIFSLPGALLFPSWRPHALALPMELGTTSTSPLQVFAYHHVPTWSTACALYPLQVKGLQPPREMLALYRPQIKGSGSVMSPTAAPKPLIALNESH